MQSKSHSAESEETGIDLAPMLDFVLNLLIFFIITTSFVKEAGITVTKPEALTAENKDNGNILIAIRPNGEIWMDKRQVDISEIRGAIERLHVERPDDTVVLIADRESETGVLTKVMDQVKLGGIGDVSIATAPPPGDLMETQPTFQARSIPILAIALGVAFGLFWLMYSRHHAAATAATRSKSLPTIDFVAAAARLAGGNPAAAQTAAAAARAATAAVKNAHRYRQRECGFDGFRHAERGSQCQHVWRLLPGPDRERRAPAPCSMATSFRCSASRRSIHAMPRATASPAGCNSKSW